MQHGHHPFPIERANGQNSLIGDFVRWCTQVEACHVARNTIAAPVHGHRLARSRELERVAGAHSRLKQGPGTEAAGTVAGKSESPVGPPLPSSQISLACSPVALTVTLPNHCCIPPALINPTDADIPWTRHPAVHTGYCGPRTQRGPRGRNVGPADATRAPRTQDGKAIPKRA